MGLETVKKLQPRVYDWKETEKRDIGFIAEEVESVDPLLVAYSLDEEGNEELINVKYSRLTSLLTKAIQELNQKVDKNKVNLGFEIEDIRGENERLREENKRLNERVDEIENGMAEFEERMKELEAEEGQNGRGQS